MLSIRSLLQSEQDAKNLKRIFLLYMRYLEKGTEVAQAEAAQTLAEVKAAMRINYFDDEALIQGQQAEV